MSSILINNLSINFRLYHDHSPSIKNSIINTLSGKKTHGVFSDFYAIKNFSCRFTSGERVGIIGDNGAGKSTLLKAICRIYEDYSGEIKIKGKIAALLELGSGFHPEFTGRENIYFNGAILGFDKNFIDSIIVDVINFSEISDFMDTPVKYYSTGMYMRLAFSLATSINPDILILDEIFSGGDASFIEKARKRMMGLVSRSNIMIMVSHDHVLIEELCNRVIWIEHGQIIKDGAAREIIKEYLNRR
jgi:ABC-type polysaccharide/polyol phosphate transport system ATPase subunit